MSHADDLLPLKRVLELTGVSRSTLWRVSESGMESFPQPLLRGRRLFWRREDLAAIKSCVEAFDGRSVFDRMKRNERRRRESQHAALTELKHAKVRSRRSKGGQKKPPQGDLFGI